MLLYFAVCIMLRGVRVPDSAPIVNRRVCAPRPTTTRYSNGDRFLESSRRSAQQSARRTPPHVRTALFPRLKPKPTGARVTAMGVRGRSVNGGEGLNDGGW